MKKVIIAALSLISAVAFLGCSAFAGSSATAAPANKTVAVATGDIVQTVSGPGVVKFVDPVAQKTPVNVKLTKTDVKVGDVVAKGDPIAEFDAAALSADIAKLNTTVTQLRQQEQGLALSFRSKKTLTAGVSGRVKAIYVAEGDAVDPIVQEKGGIVLISADGKMTVQISASGLKANDEVVVKMDNYHVKGNVSKIEDGTMTVTFPDDKVLPGDTVDVYQDDVLLGSGQAQIDLPYLLSADGGIVTSVSVKINDMLYPFSKVAAIKYITAGDAYQAVLDQLSRAQDDLDAARALRDQGAFLAEQNGVIASILPEGTYPSGTKIADIYPKGEFEFTVAVDELDIFSVVLGQTATIQFDGIPDKTFDATVSKIAGVGQVANGFTTYAVTLKVTDDGTLKSGLNGTVKIVINQQAGVLVLPVEAIQEDSNGTYVTLAGSEQAKTPVTLGISDGVMVEIVSGLAAEDQVVIPTAADFTGSAQ